MLETIQTMSRPNCYGQASFQTLHPWLFSGHASGRQPHQTGDRRPWLSHWAVFAFPALSQLYAGWRHTTTLRIWLDPELLCEQRCIRFIHQASWRVREDSKSCNGLS